jgi:hypothetical protein
LKRQFEKYPITLIFGDLEKYPYNVKIRNNNKILNQDFQDLRINRMDNFSKSCNPSIQQILIQTIFKS